MKRFFILRSGLSSCCKAAVNRYNKFNNLIIETKDVFPEEALKDPYDTDNRDFLFNDSDTLGEVKQKVSEVEMYLTKTTECSKCGNTLGEQFQGKYPIKFKDWEGIYISSRFRPTVRIARMESRYFCYKDDRVVRKNIKHYYTFNYKTGRLYYIQMVNGKKKELKCAENALHGLLNEFSNKHITMFLKECIKARAIHMFPEVDLMAVFYKMFKLTCPFDIANKFMNESIINELGPPSDSLTMLFRILRQPEYSKMRFLGDFGIIPNKLSGNIISAKNTTEVMDAVYNNPGKQFKKIIFNSINNKERGGSQVWYYLLNSFNRDILYTLCKSRDIEKIHFSGFVVDDPDYKYPFSTKGKATLKNMKKFVKAYGEKRLINHLIENNLTPRWGQPDAFRYFTDCISLYTQIIEKAPEYEMPRQSASDSRVDRHGRTIPGKSAFENTHDRLASDNNKIRKPNEIIDYNEKEMMLNKEVYGLRFKTAADTYELFDVGAEMNICVGGYGPGAVEKKYVIVIGYVNSKPILCMQVSKNKNNEDVKWDIDQAKLHNNMPAADNPDIHVAIGEWMALIKAESATNDLTIRNNGALYRDPQAEEDYNDGYGEAAVNF